MSHLYRKSALEKLSSPEQLDKMIVITPMSIWLAIAAGLALVAAVVLWGFYGKIPVTKNGQGIYFDVGSVRIVYSDVQGIVKECSLSTGTAIAKGDILFVIQDEEGKMHRIKSEYDGAAYDIFARKGSYVSVGAELMQLREENPSEAGYIYCYMPLAQARQVKEGMKVMVYPEYLNTKEYGHMIGEVVSVSKFILNRGDLEEQIGNADIINNLVSGQSLIGIRCELEADDSSASGYRWSNEKGNTLDITNGTMVKVDVIISNEAPVNLLF